jgi:protein-tyrosine-phosphatase
MPKINVLFLCTGNSCRSQMAEGWTRHLKGDLIEAYSAGVEVHGLNPLAVKVMAEAGMVCASIFPAAGLKVYLSAKLVRVTQISRN